MNWEPNLPNDPFAESRVWKIVASAGCGKSYTIKRTIDGLLARGVKPDGIMYLVFNRLPADEFGAALSSGDEDVFPWVNTHHAVAKRLLGIPHGCVLTDKKLVDWGAAHGMDFKEDEDGVRSEWSKTFESLNLKWNNGITELDSYESHLHGLLLRAEEEEGLYTFTRMLTKSIQLKRYPPGLRYVFVDEGQDQSPIQFEYLEFLKVLSQVEGIMVVGDDKQAINTFKGGSHQTFLDFEADRYVCLGKTHRNAPEVLRLANEVIGPVRERSPLTVESVRTGPGKVGVFDDFRAVLDLVRERIAQKKDVYILTRTNAVKRTCMGILVEENVPIEKKALERMKRVFLAMAEIGRSQKMTMEMLMQALPLDTPEDGELKRTAYWKRGVLKKFTTGSFDLDSETDAAVAYQDCFWSVSGQPDLVSLGFSAQFEKDCKLAAQGVVPKEVWAGCSNGEEYYLEGLMSEYGIDFKPVKVSTVHGVKGSECDVAVLVTNIPRPIQEEELWNQDGERRVWYVGITRARNEVYIAPIAHRGAVYTSVL